MSSPPILSPSAPQHSQLGTPSSAESQHPAIGMSERKSAAASADAGHSHSQEAHASKVVFHTSEEDEDYEDLTGTKPGTETESAAASLDQKGAGQDGGRFAATSRVPSCISEDPTDVLNMTSRTRARRPSFLDHSENIRTVLVWQDLTVSSPMRGSHARKVLLDHVSGSMTGQTIHTAAHQRTEH